jgi:hypothetical protein
MKSALFMFTLYIHLFSIPEFTILSGSRLLPFQILCLEERPAAFYLGQQALLWVK